MDNTINPESRLSYRKELIVERKDLIVLRPYINMENLKGGEFGFL